MEEIRQQEYDTNIPPSKPPQTHQKNEDAAEGGVTLLPFRIYLESGKETKTQIFASKDRSKWFEFILEKLAKSNLQNKTKLGSHLQMSIVKHEDQDYYWDADLPPCEIEIKIISLGERR